MTGFVDFEAGAACALGPELTINHAADLWARVLARLARGEALRFDLGGVTEMDSAGAQILLMAARAADSRKVGFAIERPSRAVEQVLRCLGLAASLGLAVKEGV